VQCWQFLPSLQWSALTEFDLCKMPGSEVISVCFNDDGSCLYWCERLPGEDVTHRICSMALPEGVLLFFHRSSCR
jgi:hypothetical protein